MRSEIAVMFARCSGEMSARVCDRTDEIGLTPTKKALAAASLRRRHADMGLVA
jgi:hypothetical protein